MTGKRILAVENDELVRSFLEDGLVMAGYDVDTASNGREALRKIEQGDYALIVCDVRMPELDGPGLCGVLAERGNDMLARLVFLTTPGALDAHETFLAQMGVPVLIKPIELNELHSMVGRMIDTIAEPVTV